jgi:hypothetical protein
MRAHLLLRPMGALQLQVPRSQPAFQNRWLSPECLNPIQAGQRGAKRGDVE